MTIQAAAKQAASNRLSPVQSAMVALIVSTYDYLVSPEGQAATRAGRETEFNFVRLKTVRGLGHSVVAATLPLIATGAKVVVIDVDKTEIKLREATGKRADIIVVDGWSAIERKLDKEELISGLNSIGFLQVLSNMFPKMVVLLG